LEILYLSIDCTSQMGLFKTLSDINIIDGIRCQDDKVLNWLYDNYLQTVKNHVLGNSGTIDDVSDVFQDTIIILYNQITDDNLKLTSDLKGYFYGIARNVWSAQLRRKQKTIELDTEMADEQESEEQYDPVLERIISRTFPMLKPDQQLILNLYSEGITYEEIALKMDLKNEVYARRKKYLSKEALLELVKEDPEYQEYFRLEK
jgi:RNA polymerase sigma factor (sigma-70 family)